jgi:hypothetical protein
MCIARLVHLKGGSNVILFQNIKRSIMPGATYDDESQDFSYVDDSHMNSSEYATESNIDPEGSSSSFHDITLTNNPPLPEDKYLVITKDPITPARARSILYLKVYMTYIYVLILSGRGTVLRNL